MALPNASPIVKVYYGKPVLPEVSRVLACLYEKDFQLVSFKNVDDRMPVDLIRLQASTSVPAPFFEDGSKFLFESRAICRYISEKYVDRGNLNLLGRDLLDRVSIEQWLKSEEQSFDPPSRALALHLAFHPSSKSYNELLEESERLAKVLDVYNHRLGESKYLAGDEFTLADLTHLPNSQYIYNSDEWGHLFYERENVKRWWEEVSARPSWTNVVEEINIREEDEDDEELTEEVEENFIRITRPPPKTSLKESIFQPIKASAQLPVKPKSTFTISKNVASPRSSVQVTIPDKRGFSVSVPAIKGDPVETARIQSHSTLHSDATTTKSDDVSAKTKQPVTDAKVTMEDSAIPPTGTQVPSTAHIYKASTKPTRVPSQSTMPVTDAKVTMEESTIPPTGTQVPSTARIDKASAKPTGVPSQCMMPVTDAKVTMEESTTPTGTQVPSTARIDKASTKPTGVASQSAMPVTDAKVTIEGSAIPPTDTQVPSTTHIDEAGTKPTGVEKTLFPPPRTEAPPTSKMVPQTKPSLEGTQAPPTEKTSTKPPSKGQGQTTTTDSKRGQAGEEPTSKEEVTEINEKAYLIAKHKKWEEQWREPEKFGEEKDTNGILAEIPKPPKLEDTTPSTTATPATTTPSETARQEPATDKSTNLPAKEPSESGTTTKPKDTTPLAATQGSVLGKTSEASPAPAATPQASLSNSTVEIQGGITDKTNNVLASKPQKNQDKTPLTTQIPAAEITSRRPEPLTNKLTTAPAKDQSKSTVPDTQKELSPGKTTTKPQDTAPAVTTQKTTTPDATQLPPPPFTNETTGGISTKTSNFPTQTPAVTFPTATLEPMTDTPNNVPSTETPKPTGPAAQEDSSRGAVTKKPNEATPLATESTNIPAATQKSSRETTGKSQVNADTQKELSPGKTTTKPQDTAPAVTTQKTTTPDATQLPPPPFTNETTGGISNKTSNFPTQTPAATFPTATLEPMTDTPNNVPSTETPKPTGPAAQEDSSRGAVTKKPNEATPLATESTNIPAATQKSSRETTGKSQVNADTQKELSPGKTTTKPQDTAPAVTTQKTTTPDATQLPPPPFTNETTGGISSKTSNFPTQTPAATFPTATPEPMTDTPNNVPSTETPKPTGPAAQEDSSRGAVTKKPNEATPLATESTNIPAATQKSSRETTGKSQVPADTQKELSPGKTTTKPQDTAPAVTTQKTTTPDATQLPPPPFTNETTGGISSKTSNFPTQTPAATFPTATPEPMTDTPNNVPSTETSKPTGPTAQEDSSRGAVTKKPNEATPLATESTNIPAATQKSSRETTGKSQVPAAATQTPPADEVTSGITDVSRPRTAPAKSQSENISQNLGDDATKSEQAKTDLSGASTGTKLDNDLAQNSQAIAQETPLANGAPSKPPATPNTEKARSVDEISSNESSTKPRTEQNSEPDSQARTGR